MRGILGLLAVFILFSISLFVLWSFGPLPENSERPSFPRDIDGLQKLSTNLANYRKSHGTYTFFLFSAAYIYKQTFAIPGSFFMNLLAGALFGTIQGVLLVGVLNCLGASLCYILSSWFATQLVEKYLKERIDVLRMKVDSQRDRLLMFLLSARVFPFTPHWLLNMSSPFFNIPLYIHAISILIGLFPYNFLCVRAGTVLSEVRSAADVFDFWTLTELFCVSMILLIAAQVSKNKSKSANNVDLFDPTKLS